MIIPLQDVIYDERARNGVWCQLKYPNHDKGCPNFPKCIECKEDFTIILKDPLRIIWYAIIQTFDLKSHANKMKRLHPKWTDKQCRCVLYWQNGIRKKLKEEALDFMYQVNEGPDDILLEIPEAHGVNIFATLAKVGIKLKSNPDLVYKVMLVGKHG